MNLPAYPKYKPSGVEWLGDIAYDWTVRSIKHLVSTPVTDGPHETPEIFDEGIPFVSAEAVSGGRINFEKIRGHITAEDHKRFSRKYKPQRGDIYLIKSGATTGRVAMVETDIEFNIWSPLAAIRCEPNMADQQFLFFYLQSKEFQTAVELSWSFGTQQNIGMGVIQNLAVPLPTLTEQRAIAAFLDRETGRVDRLVAKKRELIERLKEKRTALISRAVTRGLPAEAAAKANLTANPRLKPTGIDWLGDIPKHWEVKRLKFTIKERLQYGANESSEIDDPDLPRYVRITDIDDKGKLRPETFRSLPVVIAREYYLEDGDVLFARSGATSGKTFLYRLEWGTCAYAGYLIRARLNQKKIAPQFLRHFTDSVNYWQWLSSSLIQATIQNVSAEKYSDLALPLPPLPEQTAIAAYLDEETAKLDSLMAKVEEAVERLQEYRTALVTAAVTGKIDVRSHFSTTAKHLHAAAE